MGRSASFRSVGLLGVLHDVAALPCKMRQTVPGMALAESSSLPCLRGEIKSLRRAELTKSGQPAFLTRLVRTAWRKRLACGPCSCPTR
jgi:hypothetical protein